MTIRKKISILLTASVFAVSGCGAANAQSQAPAAGGSDKLRIVCTTFSGYDWVKQIMGDAASGADITYLLESGTDLHNFQPTADDIIKISDCDIFIYAGGESDEWVEDTLENAVNKDMKTVSMLEAVGSRAVEEELKEGMEAEHEEDDDDDDKGHEHEDEPEYDEHIWLSVANAKTVCGRITDCLCEADPGNAEKYRSGLTAYTAELDKLDADFKAVTDNAAVKTLVFGDRFPFRYFTDDYGLDYYAAFAGCSAETEASFETIVFLANKVDELGVKTVYTIENSDSSIARTIIDSTKTKDAQIAELNSLQSVSRAQIDGGATYISLMRGNLDVLRETLK